MIVLSLVLLIFFAYRGWSIIFIAPVFAVVAAIGSGHDPMPVFSEIYMTKAAEYFKTYYPVFLLGAIFAKIMEEGGLAASVANKIVRSLGKEKAILAILIGCGVLTYGGLSVFVVAFVMYPFAAILFREANYAKKLLPGLLWMGIFTYSMVAIPGTPQIQNIIPTAYFGTTTWAGIGLGLIGAALYFVMSWGWISYRAKKLQAAGFGYGTNLKNEPEQSSEELPDWKLSSIPLVMVIVLNLIISNPFGWSWAYHWDLSSLDSFAPLNLSLLAGSVGKVQAIWSINAALKQALLGISIGDGPLGSAVITTLIMCGITGSASGGETIALGMLGDQWLAMANQIGMSPEVLHRIVALASECIDTPPHSGALITLMAVCGLNHKESYYDVFILTLLKTSVAFICLAIFAVTGII